MPFREAAVLALMLNIRVIVEVAAINNLALTLSMVLITAVATPLTSCSTTSRGGSRGPRGGRSCACWPASSALQRGPSRAAARPHRGVGLLARRPRVTHRAPRTSPSASVSGTSRPCSSSTPGARMTARHIRRLPPPHARRRVLAGAQPQGQPHPARSFHKSSDGARSRAINRSVLSRENERDCTNDVPSIPRRALLLGHVFAGEELRKQNRKRIKRRDPYRIGIDFEYSSNINFHPSPSSSFLLWTATTRDRRRPSQVSFADSRTALHY